MDQEQLVRHIMTEVMKDLDKQKVEFTKKACPEEPAAADMRSAPTTLPEPSQPSTSETAALTTEHYPLAEKHPEMVSTPGGKNLTELTFDKVKSGELSADEFKITPRTLELQAQVADDAGRAPFAANLRRAAELVVVPDERLLEIYNALRPYRSTKQELLAIADELATKFDARITSAFVRQAAEVYEKRDRLRVD